MFARLLREPLIHFLIIGALMFAAYSWLNPDTTADDRRIMVNAAIVDRLVQGWTRQWRRPPDENELAGLVREHLREEILYREAMKMGLDQDDTIIRRRLAQKMEFLTEDLATAVAPTDQELREFFAEQRETFAEPARLSFSHVFINPDRRGASSSADAELILSELQAARVADPGERGDTFLMQSSYEFITQQDAAQLFGKFFAERLFEIEPGNWTGPVESGFGLHLVRVSERQDLRIPAFEEVVERVSSEFEYARKREANEAVLEGMKANYEIVIDIPDEATGDS
jgi:hypothetical protein